MFELKISNLSEAVWLSQQWATHTISLLDPDIDDSLIQLPISTPEVVVRRYFFHDITPRLSLNQRFREAKVVTRDQIEDILGFTTSLQSSDKLLVHCHAGVSRSTAVACGVLCQHGFTPKMAVRYVLSIRYQAFPNQYILQLFDKILELQGQLEIAGTEEVNNFHYDNL